MTVHLHRALDLPALPHAAARVVRAAEDGDVDVVFFEFFIHVLKIHAPNAVLVAEKRAVDDFKAVVFKAARKADISGAVHEHGVARRGKSRQRRNDAAQYAVFIADMRTGQSLDTVPVFLPADNRVKICVRRRKIAERRMFRARDDRVLDFGQRRKIHVRHPHGDHIKPLFRFVRCETGAKAVDGNRIHAVALQMRGKIVLHSFSAPFLENAVVLEFSFLFYSESRKSATGRPLCWTNRGEGSII